MNFCNVCDNMYYIKTDEEQQHKLIYYCRKCGNEDSNITSDTVCVSKTHLKRTKQKHNGMINQYTHLDPTLPRINTIRCPNADCDTNTKPDVSREVIFMRYDDINMKYIYLCAKCTTVWKTSDKQ